MKKAISPIVALLSLCTTMAAEPWMGYVYPSGLQVGTTNRFVIGGQALNGKNR